MGGGSEKRDMIVFTLFRRDYRGGHVGYGTVVICIEWFPSTREICNIIYYVRVAQPTKNKVFFSSSLPRCFSI